jgi:hypothetical protein
VSARAINSGCVVTFQAGEATRRAADTSAGKVRLCAAGDLWQCTR